MARGDIDLKQGPSPLLLLVFGSNLGDLFSGSPFHPSASPQPANHSTPGVRWVPWREGGEPGVAVLIWVLVSTKSCLEAIDEIFPSKFPDYYAVGIASWRYVRLNCNGNLWSSYSASRQAWYSDQKFVFTNPWIYSKRLNFAYTVRGKLFIFPFTDSIDGGGWAHWSESLRSGVKHLRLVQASRIHSHYLKGFRNKCKVIPLCLVHGPHLEQQGCRSPRDPASDTQIIFRHVFTKAAAFLCPLKAVSVKQHAYELSHLLLWPERHPKVNNEESGSLNISFHKAICKSLGATVPRSPHEEWWDSVGNTALPSAHWKALQEREPLPHLVVIGTPHLNLGKPWSHFQ